MLFSMARLSVMVATLLLPIYVQAVAFSVDNFEGIAVGKPMNLSWWGDKTPVTIKLMQGPPEALDAVVTIACEPKNFIALNARLKNLTDEKANVAGESYTWTPTTIPAGTYVLSITQGTETNYSPQFAVASTPAPTPAGPKSSTKAAAGAAPPSAVMAAFNGRAGVCASDASESDTSAAYPCASNVKMSLGHFPRVAGGVGKMDAAIGAAVVGMTLTVIFVL